MKILIDIGHPAHVHFFKNFIWEMQKRGHEIKITAREKDVTFHLLKAYGFDFVNLGKHRKKLLDKISGIVAFNVKLFKIAKKFKPDILTSIGSPYLAQVGKFIKKPVITFVDSEPLSLRNTLVFPFSNVILTPKSFRKNLGSKHIRYNGFQELAYLHPMYFKPKHSVLKEIGLNKKSKFFILRFVSWLAAHDIGQSGFRLKEKIKLVQKLRRYGSVFITSEGKLPRIIEEYRINVSPEKIHDLLFYASLLIGDTQTMTTEAAILGTPAIRSNSFVGPNDMGNFIELEKSFGLIYNIRQPKKAINKALELAQIPSIKKKWREKRNKLLRSKINVTKFMIWFIENYPQSFKEMKENPELQRRFR